MNFEKPCILFFAVFLLFSGASGQKIPGSTYITSVSGTKDSLPTGYVPPLVSNGSLSMLVDYTGCQVQQQYQNMTPAIYWAGRRYGPPRDGLVPFGHFEQELVAGGLRLTAPDTWSQSLNKKEAEVVCRNDYSNGISVETVVFTHLQHDLIVVKKRFVTKSSAPQSVDYTFKYQLTPPGNENLPPRRLISKSAADGSTGGIQYQFETDAYKPAKGVILIFSDKTAVVSTDRQAVKLGSKFEVDLKKPAEITYYLLFSDTMDGEDYQDRTMRLSRKILDEGYESQATSHRKEWQTFWDESYVRLPDPRLEEVYNTAQYHLRINATKWSFPVGVYSPSHWNGRYFGWDEMFCFQALASSNHLSVSKRCPEFRFSVLPRAMGRVAHYSDPAFGARYPWETLEDGIEGAPQSFGFWSDHVFHMSNIANSSWLQYLYNDNTEYLRTTGFPVIRECARFFVSHMVYENKDGSMFVGKCTDLERLGPAKQNPFMTACGVIHTLESAVKASAILNVGNEESARWSHIAARLRESLPHENGMYVPYAGCKDKSVAAMGGLFPYPVFDADNQLQRNAAYDFITNGRASGNMYPVGNAVCAWYAGWMASALALLGDREEPAGLFAEGAGTAGCFAEMFEINEPGVVVKTPWFSTASGNMVYAMNQMLLQSKENQLLIAPAVPFSWKDFSFKLACYGNLTASVSVKNGVITKLILTPSDAVTTINKKLIIPGQYLDKNILKTIKLPYEIREGICTVDVSVEGEVYVINTEKTRNKK